MLEAFRRLFDNDMDVMSREMKYILSNPEDAKVYRDAVQEIRKGAKKKTIKLSNNKELTLIQ